MNWGKWGQVHKNKTKENKTKHSKSGKKCCFAHRSHNNNNRICLILWANANLLECCLFIVVAVAAAAAVIFCACILFCFAHDLICSFLPSCVCSSARMFLAFIWFSSGKIRKQTQIYYSAPVVRHCTMLNRIKLYQQLVLYLLSFVFFPVFFPAHSLCSLFRSILLCFGRFFSFFSALSIYVIC